MHIRPQLLAGLCIALCVLDLASMVTDLMIARFAERLALNTRNGSFGCI